MNLLITLTSAGLNSGPFNLYSNVDGYQAAFESDVPKQDLLDGYVSILVPDGTTLVRVQSDNNLCTNYIDLSTAGTTTTTTTLPPPCYTFVSAPYNNRIVITYINCSGNLQTLEHFCTTGTCTKEICARLIIGASEIMTNTGPCIL